MQISFKGDDFISFRNIARRGAPGSYGSPSFNFFRDLHTVFYNGCTNLQSHNSVLGFPFLHTLTKCVISCFFDNNHSNGHEMVSHGGFNLQFP